MDEEDYLNNEEIQNLLKEMDFNKKTKVRYKEFFETDKRIRDLINKNKMSEHSLQVILNILSNLRVNLAIHTLPEENKLDIQINNSGFKTNTDFNYARFMNEIEEIEEPKIKKEMVKMIKEIKKPMMNAEKELLKLQKEKQKYGCKLICPYCKEEYVKEFGTDKNKVEDEFVEQCPSCGKEYKVLAGKVTLWRGRGTGVVSYGLPEYTTRIKNKDGERTIIFRTKYNLLHTKTGDVVYFSFKNKFLSSSFSENPCAMINATSNTYSLI